MTHKQVIVIRKDLKMRRGKEISQGCHASMGALLNAGEYNKVKCGKNTHTEFILELDDRIGPWIEGPFAKICVTVNSEEELVALVNKAKAAGIITCLITDSGRTEFNGVATITCCAIGPDKIEKIDTITGGLPLY